MKPIESALHPIDAYLVSLSRDPEHGWHVLEIGLPKTWVYDENTKISCEVTEEYDQGVIIKIAPKKKGIVVDDLVAFVEVIIKTNEKIAEKEKEFTESLEAKKKELESLAKGFYKELDDLKESSFQKAGTEFSNTLEAKPKRGRPKGSTSKKTVTEKTPTVTEETEVITKE